MTNKDCNMALVEAFGRLEQLCNQRYGGRHGVTDYIEDMKAHCLPGTDSVAHWEDTLQRLKDVRHKRNKLSHGEASFQERWATEADVRFLEAFRQNILRQTDPLALCRKAGPRKKRKKTTAWIYWIAAVGVIVMILGLLLYLY